MARTMSATEARTRLGEILRLVWEERETVTVERRGKPYVVFMPIDEYERLRRAAGRPPLIERSEPPGDTDDPSADAG
jgi:prevent-host-death family protein